MSHAPHQYPQGESQPERPRPTTALSVLAAAISLLLGVTPAKASGFSFSYELPVSFQVTFSGLTTSQWQSSGNAGLPPLTVECRRPVGSNIFQGTLADPNTAPASSDLVMHVIGDPTSGTMTATILRWSTTGGSMLIWGPQTFILGSNTVDSNVTTFTTADSQNYGLISAGAVWTQSGSQNGGGAVAATVSNVTYDPYRVDNAFLNLITGFTTGFTFDLITTAIASVTRRLIWNHRTFANAGL